MSEQASECSGARKQVQSNQTSERCEPISIRTSKCPVHTSGFLVVMDHSGLVTIYIGDNDVDDVSKDPP